MTTYVLAFLLGVITGVSLLLWHQKDVKDAVDKAQTKADMEANRLRAENRRLREDLQAQELCDTARNARQQGKVVGMREAANRDRAQRFVDDLTDYGQRNVTIGGGQK